MDISHIRAAISFLIICIIIYLYSSMKRKYYNNKKHKVKPVIKSSDNVSNQCNQSVAKQTMDKKITHKEILLKLHEASDKCYIKIYALRCIELVSYCPHLINIPHGTDGYTPFHRVCFHGNTCLIEYMLAKGANPFFTTYNGENAMSMALYYFLNHPDNNDFTCLNILCEAGCHLDKPNLCSDIFMKAALNTNNKVLAEWILLHSQIRTPLIRSYSEPHHPMC